MKVTGGGYFIEVSHGMMKDGKFMFTCGHSDGTEIEPILRKPRKRNDF